MLQGQTCKVKEDEMSYREMLTGTL